MTNCSDISNGYIVLLQGKSVNEMCITYGVIYVRHEARAMGCLLKSQKWIENNYNTVKPN